MMLSVDDAGWAQQLYEYYDQDAGVPDYSGLYFSLIAGLVLWVLLSNIKWRH